MEPGTTHTCTVVCEDVMFVCWGVHEAGATVWACVQKGISVNKGRDPTKQRR